MQDESQSLYFKIDSLENLNKDNSQPFQVKDYEIHRKSLSNLLNLLKNFYSDKLNLLIENKLEQLEIPIISTSSLDKFYTQRYKSIEMHMSITLLSNKSLDDKFLRNYQKIGVDWLIDGDYKILADDMGLGKTLQSIKAIEKLLNAGEFSKILIISPISLIKTWKIELKKWSKMIAFASVDQQNTDSKQLLELFENNQIIITNYEQIRKTDSYFSILDFDLVIADEAHKVRNTSSAIYQGLVNIRRRKFWALTGTPIENKPKDLGNLLSIINPLKFSDLTNSKQTLFIQDSALPYILRRTKKDVLKELPDVLEHNIPLEFGKIQRMKYEEIWSKRGETIKKVGSHFAVLSELRKVCDLVEEESIKNKEALDLILKIMDNKEKVIIFSFYIPVLLHLRKLLNKEKVALSFITGEQTSEERDIQISQFQNDENVTALLASARVASEGLTLTEANNVIFLNRWWNPSNNLQARDRVVRIGQEKTVSIYNLYVSDTVEDRLNEILNNKEAIYREITDGFIEDPEHLARDLLKN